jgi:hypothetical protein
MLSCGVGCSGGGEDAGEAIPSVRMERTTRPETATLSVPFSRSLVIWTAAGIESQKVCVEAFPCSVNGRTFSRSVGGEELPHLAKRDFSQVSLQGKVVFQRWTAPSLDLARLWRNSPARACSTLPDHAPSIWPTRPLRSRLASSPTCPSMDSSCAGPRERSGSGRVGRNGSGGSSW